MQLFLYKSYIKVKVLRGLNTKAYPRKGVEYEVL